MSEHDARRAELLAELADLDAQDNDEGAAEVAEAVADAVAETVEPVAEAVAAVVTGAAETSEPEPVDPIDMAAAQAVVIEAQAAADVQRIEAEAAAAAMVAGVQADADAAIVDSLPEPVGEPADTAPRNAHWFFRGMNR
jgi:hypothetical protein